jgi:branched-chain amino acid transport system ATP-binding protein
MLRVQNLAVHYGGIAAVRRVSFDVAAGECVAIIGPNGAGKSSTLRAISGLAPVSEGSIAFGDRELNGLAAHEIARLGIAHVPEGRHVFGPLSVEDNLRLGRQRLGSVDEGAGLERVYATMPKLKERRRQKAGSLSGGEQQMLVIGRALIGEPKILMLDEPSMGLAPQVVDTVFELLAELRNAGQTILLVEQNAQQALTFAERSVVLNLGEVKMQGPSSELLEHADVINAYLGSVGEPSEASAT